MKLLIVESPHKAETISKFLPNDFKVVATIGHIKNLPKKELGVKQEDSKFIGKWELDKSKNELLNYLKKLSKNAQAFYIATDDDREGERIGNDVVEFLKLKEYYRITFHEISKKAVLRAIENARLVDENIVNAQIARRIIDRIIGYPISETIRWYFLKNKLLPFESCKNLGIGRVSAPALSLIIENEKKIEAFEPKIYKKVAFDYHEDNIFFRLKNKQRFIPEVHDKEYTLFVNTITNPNAKHVVEQYNRKIKEVKPPAPLTTTWMQRATNYLYGFDPMHTMKIAQELYDKGLITYIRTDSTHISDEAIQEIWNVVYEMFGEEYLYTEKHYKEDDNAHESIRPVYFKKEYFPKELKKHLTEDQFKLYDFIFYRNLAIFMKPALYDNSTLVVNVENNKFSAESNNLEFDGWEKVGKKWKDVINDDEARNLPLPKTLEVGEVLSPINIVEYDYEGRRPQRYGVGRFLTTIEKLGLARPSTIATILPNLEKKGYIKIVNNIIIPQELGKKIIEFLEKYANWLIDFDEIRGFEETLDLIEKGKIDKDDLINSYKIRQEEFEKSVGYDKKEVEASKQNKKFLGKCPKCKKSLVYETKKTFRCSLKECDFVFFKNSFSFFEKFAKYIPERAYAEYFEMFLKNGNKLVFQDLYSQKQDKSFTAKIAIKPYTYQGKEYWGFSFAK